MIKKLIKKRISLIFRKKEIRQFLSIFAFFAVFLTQQHHRLNMRRLDERNSPPLSINFSEYGDSENLFRKQSKKYLE